MQHGADFLRMTKPFTSFRLLWEGYSRCLLRRPLLTKTTTGAIIFFSSDSVAQLHACETVSEWKASRSLSGAGFGIVATTWLHFWWGWLEGMVGSRIPMASHRLANTLVKVAVDQSMAAPLYTYSYFVVTNMGQQLLHLDYFGWSLVQQVWADTNAKAAAMLAPTMMLHWTVWPFVHSFNFYFMPLHQRVLIQNLVLVGWSGFLSHLNHEASTVLMTPTEEAHVAVQRFETRRRDQQEEALRNEIATRPPSEG